jgi:uncharacterized pyridoxamine 5'-phosphate oxidase family protein
MMNEVLQFLKENPIFYIATVDGDTPKVRPFGFVMEYDGKLCFCTNNQKNVYRQLKTNPKFEISTTSKDGKWLRLKGKAVFITNRESKKAALDASPSLGRMYSVDDSIFEVFCADEGEATFSDMKGESRTLKL